MLRCPATAAARARYLPRLAETMRRALPGWRLPPEAAHTHVALLLNAANLCPTPVGRAAASAVLREWTAQVVRAHPTYSRFLRRAPLYSLAPLARVRDPAR